MSFCPHCGAVSEPFYKFCGSCGNPIASGPNAPSGSVDKKKGPQYNYCQECGNKEPTSVIFCQVCKSDRMEPTKPIAFLRPRNLNKMVGLQLGFAALNLIVGIRICFEGGIGPMVFGIIYISMAAIVLAVYTILIIGRKVGNGYILICNVLESFLNIGFGTIIGIAMVIYLSRPKVKAYLLSPITKGGVQVV